MEIGRPFRQKRGAGSPLVYEGLLLGPLGAWRPVVIYG